MSTLMLGNITLTFVRMFSCYAKSLSRKLAREAFIDVSISFYRLGSDFTYRSDNVISFMM
ncbi:hypothetical protein SAMN05518847_1011041 [Paenibacillus sp. OV219]|nr:hypothetical protein SAMN05518847_1011041 [Paenibacillus sp. OV219]